MPFLEIVRNNRDIGTSVQNEVRELITDSEVVSRAWAVRGGPTGGVRVAKKRGSGVGRKRKGIGYGQFHITSHLEKGFDWPFWRILPFS
jgi:hypothetical protein